MFSPFVYLQVDTHVHAAACMPEKQFLEFIKTKVDTDDELKFTDRADRKITLRAVITLISSYHT